MRVMRREIERADVADAPVVSEGGLSPSTLSTGLPGTMSNPSTIGPLAAGQRWSVARKREVVLRLLRGESVELLSRELGVPIYKLEQWREKADAALDGALKEPVGSLRDDKGQRRNLHPPIEPREQDRRRYRAEEQGRRQAHPLEEPDEDERGDHERGPLQGRRPVAKGEIRHRVANIMGDPPALPGRQ